MINRKFKAKIFGITFLVFSILAGAVSAQNKDSKPTTVFSQETRKMSVAERNNVYCAGYIHRLTQVLKLSARTKNVSNK